MARWSSVTAVWPVICKMLRLTGYRGMRVGLSVEDHALVGLPRDLGVRLGRQADRSPYYFLDLILLSIATDGSILSHVRVGQLVLSSTQRPFNTLCHKLTKAWVVPQLFVMAKRIIEYTTFPIILGKNLR